jgi:hypothetical protein
MARCTVPPDQKTPLHLFVNGTVEIRGHKYVGYSQPKKDGTATTPMARGQWRLIAENAGKILRLYDDELACRAAIAREKNILAMAAMLQSPLMV